MENASKALIIAGSILLAILLISLVLYARSSVSEYQNSKLELDRVENLAKFNDQFAQYDRKDVAGYELISLANKVADYNAKYSKSGTNNEGYNPIKMEISFKEIERKKLAYGSDNILITEDSYTQTSITNEIMLLIKPNLEYESKYGGEDVISRIAKNINSIFKIDNSISEDEQLKQKKQALKKFYEIVSQNVRNNKLGLPDITDWSSTSQITKAYQELYNKINQDAYKYYEYIQFKRCIFKCDNMKYDDKTGRISEITYSFVKLR